MPGIVCFIPLEKGIGVEDPVLLSPGYLLKSN